MLCGFYLITHSVVTNNVKTEKDFKSDSLYIGFEFEARCHLAQPSLSVFDHLHRIMGAQGNALFLVVSMGCGRQREKFKLCLLSSTAKVLTEVPGATCVIFPSCHTNVTLARERHHGGMAESKAPGLIPGLFGLGTACTSHVSFLWLWFLSCMMR